MITDFMNGIEFYHKLLMDEIWSKKYLKILYLNIYSRYTK